MPRRSVQYGRFNSKAKRAKHLHFHLYSIMNNNNSLLSSKTLTSFLFLLLSFSFSFQLIASSFCQHDMASLGGLQTSENTPDIDALARFAVQEHNNKHNAMVEFVRVLKANEQVVSGILHHLTIEAIEAGKKRIYEAKVWVKPWLNHKELQEFKHTEDVPQLTSSDLGVNQEGHGPGWRQVPKHDPAVQDAADHAIKTIQQRSNSIFPYELQEVIDAKAEVSDEVAKFDMVLKVKRGSAEEKFKVEVHKSHHGTYHLHQMVLHT